MASTNLVALVTGASSGIGKATAQRLAAAGYTVYGTSRSGGQKTQQQNIHMVPLDVTSDESVAAAVATILRLEGRIDLLVNNAGFGVAPGGAEESSMEQTYAIFNTNFFGLVRMIRAVVPHMRKQGSGRIVNIGSVLGFIPMPFGALYSATKHAVEGYSESLDHELRTLGIRVSVVEPAYTRTDFESNMIQPDALLDVYSRTRSALNKLMPSVIAKGDDPSVVAEVVLKAATANKPKVRYAAGTRANWLRLMHRYAPTSLFDSGVRRELGLHKQSI